MRNRELIRMFVAFLVIFKNRNAIEEKLEQFKFQSTFVLGQMLSSL